MSIISSIKSRNWRRELIWLGGAEGAGIFAVFLAARYCVRRIKEMRQAEMELKRLQAGQHLP